MIKIENIKGHFHTINQHKKTVMVYCFKIGLYRQGLLHDLSKYSPVEFIPGCIYYQGNRSPNNAERENTGVSRAWLHHKGRNRHHFEYWVDYAPRRKGADRVSGSYMPVRYVLEMFCDRIAACRTYQKENYTDRSPLEYYLKGRPDGMLHPLSADILEKLLRMLANRGEEETIRFIRKKVIPNMRRIDRRNQKIAQKQYMDGLMEFLRDYNPKVLG